MHIRWSSEYFQNNEMQSNIMNALYFHFNFDRNLEFIYQLEILPSVDTVTHFYTYMCIWVLDCKQHWIFCPVPSSYCPQYWLECFSFLLESVLWILSFLLSIWTIKQALIEQLPKPHKHEQSDMFGSWGPSDWSSWDQAWMYHRVPCWSAALPWQDEWGSVERTGWQRAL